MIRRYYYYYYYELTVTASVAPITLYYTWTASRVGLKCPVDTASRWQQVSIPLSCFLNSLFFDKAFSPLWSYWWSVSLDRSRTTCRKNIMGRWNVDSRRRIYLKFSMFTTATGGTDPSLVPINSWQKQKLISAQGQRLRRSAKSVVLVYINMGSKWFQENFVVSPLHQLQNYTLVLTN